MLNSKFPGPLEKPTSRFLSSECSRFRSSFFVRLRVSSGRKRGLGARPNFSRLDTIVACNSATALAFMRGGTGGFWRQALLQKVLLLVQPSPGGLNPTACNASSMIRPYDLDHPQLQYLLPQWVIGVMIASEQDTFKDS